MTSSLFNWFQFGLNLFGIILLMLIFLLLVLAICVPLVLKNKKQLFGDSVKIQVKKLNDVYEKYKNQLEDSIFSPKTKKNLLKEKKLEEKKKLKEKEEEAPKKRVFVLDFKGDMSASQVTFLREHVTALLQVAKNDDEVVVRLESGGGVVHGYGLAASQLARIREQNIPLTVCVDKVAASGGYMMACLADKILAAPFAILGSIGVLSMVPNFHKLLKKHDIDYFEVTAGKYKRTLTPLGEPTAEKIEKSFEKVHEIHMLFKEHVKQYRSQVDIENISNGDYWFGHQAIGLKLVDEIKTSDDYLLNLSHKHDVFLVYSPQAHGLRSKIFSGFSNLWYTFFNH